MDENTKKERNRCRGLTSRGLLCRVPALKGQCYCWRHQDQAAESTLTDVSNLVAELGETLKTQPKRRQTSDSSAPPASNAGAQAQEEDNGVSTSSRDPIAAAQAVLACHVPDEETGFWFDPNDVDYWFGDDKLPFEWHMLGRHLPEGNHHYDADPALRRRAIRDAIEELLDHIQATADRVDLRGSLARNSYLGEALRLAYRQQLTELLGMWYREERGR